jgi:hypothetical protein
MAPDNGWLVFAITGCALALAGIIISTGRQTLTLRITLAAATAMLLAVAVSILQ